MATTTISGAGRRKAAAQRSKHDPVIGTTKTARKRDEITAPMATGTLSSKPSKPGAFASSAEVAGWEVKRLRNSDGSKTVRASRGAEELEMTWSRGDKFIYPGNYFASGFGRNVRNASEGRQILGSTPEANAPNSVRKPRVSPVSDGEDVADGAVRELTRKVPFDPEAEPDANVVAQLRGRKVTWRNSLTGGFETGYVPPAERQVLVKGGGLKTIVDQSTFIINSKAEDTLGRRILSFCDAVGGGYRALFVDALWQVR